MSKYGARKTTIDGIVFDSNLEANYYCQLKMLMKAKIVSSFEVQPTFELQEGYKKGKRKIQPITYIADFHVYYADGREEIVDCKGLKTEVYRIKKKIFEYKYGFEIKEIS